MTRHRRRKPYPSLSGRCRRVLMCWLSDRREERQRAPHCGSPLANFGGSGSARPWTLPTASRLTSCRHSGGRSCPASQKWSSIARLPRPWGTSSCSPTAARSCDPEPRASTLASHEVPVRAMRGCGRKPAFRRPIRRNDRQQWGERPSSAQPRPVIQGLAAGTPTEPQVLRVKQSWAATHVEWQTTATADDQVANGEGLWPA